MATFFFFHSISIQLAFVATLARVLVVFEGLKLSNHDLVVHQSGQELAEKNLSIGLSDQDL